jgi:putative transposase
VTSEAITALAPRIGTRAACAAAGVPQASWYRRHRASPAPARRPPVPHRDRAQPRALGPAGRQAILGQLHSDRFADLAPAEVWAILLDEGTYLGSQSTFYRLLRAVSGTRERRRQAAHPAAVKPELAAAGPNQCWSWDITKLHGPEKWTYYHLYVILDIYSRYAVGWMLATRESAALAEKLIASSCAAQGIGQGQLTIHADRGSSMTSRPVAFLLADLAITQSHSRPHVSNDNPYSEAQFKTLKYRPYFPARFTSVEHARAHCQEFFRWYNDQHRHSGLGLHTAADVHHGHAATVRAARAEVLAAAYRHHPERFVSKPPSPPALPTGSAINPPGEKEAATH